MVTTTAQTILIIDDNQDDVLITGRVLSEIAPEFLTESASDGQSGLTRLKDESQMPALIMLDLKMPGMSGFDLLREIRADLRLKRIPVVVVTCSNLESDEKEAYAAGADSFLSKTFDMDQFRRDVESVLRRWLTN